MKIIIKNPHNLPTIDYKKLVDFQGDLKQLPDENLIKLKNSIIDNGIFLPKFVWDNNGKLYLMDGHQTIKALTSLESEGYEIPPIPYVLIEAKTEKEAAEKLLIINSRYGINNLSTEYFDKYDIDLSTLKKYMEIPEYGFDFSALEKYRESNDGKEKNKTTITIEKTNECPKCGHTW